MQFACELMAVSKPNSSLPRLLHLWSRGRAARFCCSPRRASSSEESFRLRSAAPPAHAPHFSCGGLAFFCAIRARGAERRADKTETNVRSIFSEGVEGLFYIATALILDPRELQHRILELTLFCIFLLSKLREGFAFSSSLLSCQTCALRSCGWHVIGAQRCGSPRRGFCVLAYSP